jgi:sec-independent protein translocase protein TatA
MGALQSWHVVLVVIVAMVLFGAKRLPDAARSLGRSMRILKAETRGLVEEDVRSKAEAQSSYEPLEGSVGEATPRPRTTQSDQR